MTIGMMTLQYPNKRFEVTQIFFIYIYIYMHLQRKTLSLCVYALKSTHSL